MIAVVTGAAGFIGRSLVNLLLQKGHYVIGIDSLTYAARGDLLSQHPRFKLLTLDICQLDHLQHCDAVFHLAAETHVSNSVDDPSRFFTTNVVGTYSVLERLRGQRSHNRPLLIYVSSDEVYGDVPVDHRSVESDALLPSSPYSASKAGAEMLVRAWARTYDLRTRIVRPSNCYGPYQYPEKLIPKTIRYWLLGKRMTIHGDGTQSRMWLNVEDCARAIYRVWELGEDGEAYNVPGNIEARVRDVVKATQSLCMTRLPAGEGWNPPSGNLWGCDRPGGDLRYRVDGTLIERLGWQATGDLYQDLEEIVTLELEAGVRI